MSEYCRADEFRVDVVPEKSVKDVWKGTF
jgi:hypothetical protein